MQTLSQDVRFAARLLIKRPGFSLISVVTLALGIGATTAIFTVVNAVLLRPLAYPDPDRIMALWPDRPGSTFQGVSEPKFVFWREHSGSFDGVTATQGMGSGVNLSGGDEPEAVSGVQISVDFFNVLGVHPRLGREFTQEECSPTGDRVVILNDGLWRRRFGSDPSMVGRTVLINGNDYTVAGVMPPGFRYGHEEGADVLVPMRTNPASRQEGHNYRVLARLKPGVSEAQARADMVRVFDAFHGVFPGMLWRGEEGIRVEPYLSSFTSDVSGLLWILFGAVGFVLLIACANVANLQLTHAASRVSEIAIREALGATWSRIARQLLTEGVVLAVLGGAAGLILAEWGVKVLATLIPTGLIPRLDEISFDWRVLSFALLIAVANGLIFTLAPALRASRLDVSTALKEAGTRGMTGDDRGRLRNVLVVSEIAMALVLLIGAGLLIRTFIGLRSVSPGFDSKNVLTFEVSPNGPGYDTTAKHNAYFQRSLEKIKGLTGVESAAVTSNLPLSAWLNLGVEVDGRPNSTRSTEYRMVTPEYFDVMRIPLISGRGFRESDSVNSEPVVIVNEAFARRALRDTDPLSQRLIVERSEKQAISMLVIGVVGDVKQFGLASTAPATVFVPLPQVPDGVMRAARQFVTMKFAIRTRIDPMSLSTAVKTQVLSVDPSLPLTNIEPLEQIVSRSLAQDRFNTTLLVVFSSIGLVLALIGIYGVMAYSVAQRTREIGIRMALGARRIDVLKLIVVRGAVMAVVGVGLGLIAALALTRLMQSLLFGVTPTDPATFVALSLLVTAVALAACYIPAHRAMRVDAMSALRCE
jgi:putative ABC transport system permease protein